MTHAVTRLRLPTITTQADCWGTPDGMPYAWWLTLAVDAEHLDRAQLTAALGLVVNRHESLRVVPVPGARGREQYLLDTADVPVYVMDIATDPSWREVDGRPWPSERPRWVAGLVEAPLRKLVLKVCHSVSDQLGLLLLASDLTHAIRSIAYGRPLSWRLPASFVRIALDEGSPAGQARLQRNNKFVAEAFAPGWVQKPMRPRGGERRLIQVGIAISEQSHRRFIAAAREIGVPWQSLIRAAFVKADQLVQASGNVRLQSLEHNRNDEQRRRCVANFASYLPVLINGAHALALAPKDWARQLDSQLQAASACWPVSDLTLADSGLGVEDSLRDGDGVPIYAPHLEVDTSSSTLHTPTIIPGHGDRVGTIGSISTLWRATELVLYRRPGEIVLELSDDTRRRSPDALRLLATCLLGVIHDYAAITGHPASRVLADASALRCTVGPRPQLDWPGDELIALMPEPTEV
ncbi:hypothetical protein BJQ94_18430 [Cryobacterium sp. SO2]|uniref:hypothetical protein n=1 Tax=Cryobacterium sp. SO2 TaxID=1897060 RepID=UPI00223E8931|nr:hypothetical protein [Cryobacterium sp. SO2]WEO77301.1 hypothetical protein BJQ94_18430 [Cryobacterium sp. SO2]